MKDLCLILRWCRVVKLTVVHLISTMYHSGLMKQLIWQFSNWNGRNVWDESGLSLGDVQLLKLHRRTHSSMQCRFRNQLAAVSTGPQICSKKTVISSVMSRWRWIFMTNRLDQAIQYETASHARGGTQVERESESSHQPDIVRYVQFPVTWWILRNNGQIDLPFRGSQVCSRR